MARPLRIEFPSALYHLTVRGDGGEDIYLGDEAFVTRMQAKLEQSDLDEFPRAQHHRPALPLAAYARGYPERRAAMAAAYRSGDYTLKAIAKHFGVHYSPVSRALRDFERSPGQ